MPLADTSFYKIALILEPRPEGGFTVTSPTLPELLTEGDTLQEALENVRDALAAVLEIYLEDGRELPTGVKAEPGQEPLRFEYVVTAA